MTIVTDPWTLNWILIGIILILLLFLSALWPPDSPWTPWWQMPPGIIRRMCDLAKVSSESVIYDLGSGTGRALLIAAKEYGAKGIGIEIDPLRYWISRLNLYIAPKKEKGNVVFIKENFFNISFSPATIVFIYLVPNALKRLTPKFLKEVKTGTIFVSYKYAMPIAMFHEQLKLLKHDEQMEIFVYKFTKNKK